MFETHKLNDKGFEAMKKYKTVMSVAAAQAMALMAEGRDKAIFKTKIEEGVFFGAKAIAAQNENHSEIVNYPET